MGQNVPPTVAPHHQAGEDSDANIALYMEEAGVFINLRLKRINMAILGSSFYLPTIPSHHPAILFNHNIHKYNSNHLTLLYGPPVPQSREALKSQIWLLEIVENLVPPRFFSLTPGSRTSHI